MRFCSLSTTSFPVRLKTSPSKAPVALNAQHDPQCPWARWGQQGVTASPQNPPERDAVTPRCCSPAPQLQKCSGQNYGIWFSGMPRGFLVLGRMLLLVSAAQTLSTHRTALVRPSPRAHLVLHGCHVALRPPVHLCRGLQGC